MEQHEIKLRMHELPQVILMEAQIPMPMVNNLNAYLDELMVAEDRKDHSSNLVGQIQHGQQLTMNAEHEKVIHFTQTINQLGKEYIKHFVKRIGSSKLFPDKMEVGVDEMWSVHSYAGDYNPIHDHSVPALTGLAATTWTKVPEQITKQNSPNDGSYNLFGASGNIWLQHMVYPFKGDGERRTIAANLCGWHKNNADNEAIINKMYKE